MGTLGTLLLAALVPMVMGFIWYGPLFKNAWMKASGMTEEKIQSGNMIVIFGLSYLFCLMIATVVWQTVVHQMGVFSLIQGEGGAAVTDIDKAFFNDAMATYGNKFRTFGHGAFHGVIMGFFVALPIIGMNSLFERKGFKYIAIHVGYWIICFALMGGILSQWADLPAVA